MGYLIFSSDGLSFSPMHFASLCLFVSVLEMLKFTRWLVDSDVTWNICSSIESPLIFGVFEENLVFTLAQDSSSMTVWYLLFYAEARAWPSTGIFFFHANQLSDTALLAASMSVKKTKKNSVRSRTRRTSIYEWSAIWKTMWCYWSAKLAISVKKISTLQMRH